jgi:Uma2 family endonuclease
MKAVMLEIEPQILDRRRCTGADRWDELWDGVLHMPPMPNRSHQELELSLGAWLKTYWARPRGCKVYPPINLALPGRWPADYRIPDLVLLTPDRFHIDRNEYFDGGPTVVVEIRSPGDESYEKLPFYAQLRVPEVWIIDRDTRQPEVLRLFNAGYQPVPPDGEEWVVSDVTGIRMRAEQGKLAIALTTDPASLQFLPED